MTPSRTEVRGFIRRTGIGSLMNSSLLPHTAPCGLKIRISCALLLFLYLFLLSFQNLSDLICKFSSFLNLYLYFEHHSKWYRYNRASNSFVYERACTFCKPCSARLYTTETKSRSIDHMRYGCILSNSITASNRIHMQLHTVARSECA